MTHSSPSSTALVATFLASDDATWCGSVIT
jgi:hypothetical protein